MAPIHSAQEFVRALKSPLDPPSPGGPLKVEIASQTWKDASFYVPRKAEVIVEWILGKLLKEKSKALSSNPILDLRLWHLLHEVISTDVALLSPHTRPSKTWLATLLHRTPITPIFVALLDVLGDLDSQIRKALSQIAYSCLLMIWPLAVQRVGTETLLDCFGAFLPVVQWCENDEGLVQIGIVVISSYKESFYNSPNKKKIHNTFLHTLLHRWLECAVLEISPVTNALLELIYNAGAETLFNLETLRHNHDTKSEDLIFDAIKVISNSNAKVLSCLPRLFASYVHGIQKHRGALFIQGSNQPPGAASEELRTSAMCFFAASDSLLDAVESNAQIWPIKVALLHLVNQEGLYNRNQAQASVLHRIVESARDTLGTGCKEGETEFTICVVESLSILAQIDFDLISPALSDLLLKFLLARSSQTFITFLDLLLDYYSKTRTMNIFLGHLLSSLSSRHIQAVAQPMWDVYNMSHSGPLLDAKFLAHLSKAVQTFLPGAQIESAIEILLQYLEEALGEFDKISGHDHGDRRKRRRTEVAATSVQADASAISFSLCARVASVVVSSLAMESIAPATRGEVGQRLSDLRNVFIHRKLTKAFKTIRQRAGSSVWSSQIVATSSLRLLYALEISHPAFLQPSDCSKLWENVSDSLEDDELLPELTIEMFRVLLSQPFSQDETQFRALFDQILVNMNRHFSASVSWSGQLHDLIPENQGRAKGLLALLHMVIQKWLPLIEFLASRPQIERLIRLMISVDVTDSVVATGLCTQSLVGITFHSANFWEFHRIRVVFLECLSEATSGLNEDAGLSSDSQLTGAIAAYRLLLLLPVEYMSRPARADFIKRALVADRFFSNLSVDSDRVSNYVDQSLTILRAFLKRVLAHVGHIEQPAERLYDYLKHLMAQGLRPQASVTYVSVTVEVIEVHLHELFKVSGLICIEAVQMIIHLFSQSDWHSSSSRTFDIGYQSTIRMLEFLVTDFSLSNFSHELQGSLHELHQCLLKLILPLVSNVHTSTDIVYQCNLLKLWCSLLSFGRWLGLADMPLSLETMHMKIVRMSMPTQSPASHDTDSIRVASFAILLQELHYRLGDRLSHLETVIATYTIHSQVIGVAGRQQMDDHFSKACGLLSPSDFARTLDCIYESLANNPTSAHGLAPLIQLSMILLHDHPLNTLKSMQQFATRCIAVFADHSVYTDGPLPLRLQALDFVARQCSDRSAALRMTDMGSIWTLLSRFLSASRIHDDDTTVAIFHKCVTIVGSLVRLRRDLLTPNLPHLVTILQQLMLSMRRVRPHIGAKQIILVTDTQPRYINVKNPLSMEEAKLLARLLEMLASKTTVRTNYASQDARKAESLSKPFSKHAPYVLKTYIESMNDPLCIIPSSLRKELQSGLYALCGMMKDYSRDAMMVSALDAGGKTTMKALWKEYEKQRYIGKG